jgi:anti-anti-sigma regulatory factor
MLRVTIRNGTKPTTLMVEGKLRGPWVTELEKEWSRLAVELGSRNVVADLSDVTFIDAEGRNLLIRMLEQGTELQAFDLLSRFVIDEIKLALQHKKEEGEDAHANRIG